MKRSRPTLHAVRNMRRVPSIALSPYTFEACRRASGRGDRLPSVPHPAISCRMEDSTYKARVSGIVVAGHGVASGQCGDPRFPAGTVAMQAPVFRTRGVDLDALLGAEAFLGTINVDVSPAKPLRIGAEIELTAVAWSPEMPPENFSLLHATIKHAGTLYPALIYMPDPATKPEHFQPASVIELIAPRVPELAGGDVVEVIANLSHIMFEHAEPVSADAEAPS